MQEYNRFNLICKTFKYFFMDSEQKTNSDETIESSGQHEVQHKPASRVTILAAKRKFWIEWECYLDQNPDEKGLEKLKEYLLDYIANYLDELARKKQGKHYRKMADLANNVNQEIFGAIEEESKIVFAPRKHPRNVPEDALEVLGFQQWEKQKREWDAIDENKYTALVLENTKGEGEEKYILKYTPYTKKWINILHTNWERVSEAYPVFSFQGWFINHKNVRLTDAGSENRGSMNPPPPPPPPQ
jgi:hypothetical protein